MKRIYKYTLNIIDKQKIKMPYGSMILHVDMQNENLCLWAEVDTEAPQEEETFYVRGTGQPIPDDDAYYVGSAVGSVLVWHVYQYIGREYE